MFITHVYFWSVAMAMWNPDQFTVESFAAHPVVYELKENDQMKIVTIEPGRTMELKRASILAPLILLRDYTNDRTAERYVNGAFYERHLYENASLKASLLVKPQRRGHYHIVGLINSTHYIKPLRNQMDFMGRTRHVILEIPSSTGHICHNTINARSLLGEIFGFPRVKKQSGAHIIEASIISDYSHTKSLEMNSLDPLEYVMTYMHRVSLDFHQLKPSIKIMLTGYQTTLEENVEYVNFTSSGVLAAMETVVKLKNYVARTKSHRKADLVVLITACTIVATELKNTVMLGIACNNGICTEDKGILVKDAGARNSGVRTTTHEMAHTLGADHDGVGNSASCAADDGYIMTPIDAGKKRDEFSVCTKKVIATHLRKRRAPCLRRLTSRHISPLLPRAIVPFLEEK
uniref:Reprolysin n=1 Tax=Rhipicephalus appendiculatus TaxID=34631 RepID=A0A131YM04_RHIAP